MSAPSVSSFSSAPRSSVSSAVGTGSPPSAPPDASCSSAALPGPFGSDSAKSPHLLISDPFPLLTGATHRSRSPIRCPEPPRSVVRGCVVRLTGSPSPAPIGRERCARVAGVDAHVDRGIIGGGHRLVGYRRGPGPARRRRWPAAPREAQAPQNIPVDEVDRPGWMINNGGRGTAVDRCARVVLEVAQPNAHRPPGGLISFWFVIVLSG
jgi:hypothetical protein